MASASGFGISFHYGSHSPRYYTSSVYTNCAPRGYVYYDDLGIYAEPIVYDSYYPTTYRRTYTRSYYTTRPVFRSHRTIHHRSGHHRKYVVSRRHYTSPRASIHIGSHPGRYSYRDGHSYTRYRGSHHRHHRPPVRVRVHRR